MIEHAGMSDLIIPSRRRFLLGASAILAAPAIVRVASIMPVSVIDRRPMAAVMMDAHFAIANIMADPCLASGKKSQLILDVMRETTRSLGGVPGTMIIEEQV